MVAPVNDGVILGQCGDGVFVRVELNVRLAALLARAIHHEVQRLHADWRKECFHIGLCGVPDEAADKHNARRLRVRGRGCWRGRRGRGGGYRNGIRIQLHELHDVVAAAGEGAENSDDDRGVGTGSGQRAGWQHSCGASEGSSGIKGSRSRFIRECTVNYVLHTAKTSLNRRDKQTDNGGRVQLVFSQA